MFKKEKYVREEDLFKILTTRDNIIKERIEEDKEYFSEVKRLLQEQIKETDKKIKELKNKINEKEDNDYYFNKKQSAYQYAIEVTEEDRYYTFETEKAAIIFFIKEVWQKKAFKANEIMWDAIYEAMRNGVLELDKNKINDE